MTRPVYRLRPELCGYCGDPIDPHPRDDEFGHPALPFVIGQPVEYLSHPEWGTHYLFAMYADGVSAMVVQDPLRTPPVAVVAPGGFSFSRVDVFAAIEIPTTVEVRNAEHIANTRGDLVAAGMWRDAAYYADMASADLFVTEVSDAVASTRAVLAATTGDGDMTVETTITVRCPNLLAWRAALKHLPLTDDGDGVLVPVDPWTIEAIDLAGLPDDDFGTDGQRQIILRNGTARIRITGPGSHADE